jgi:hypothetical protein
MLDRIALLLLFCFSTSAFPVYEYLRDAHSAYSYVKSPGDATYDYVSLHIAMRSIILAADA